MDTPERPHPHSHLPRPQAAVVIPCFNHGRFVADAVRSCLSQVDAEVRIIVVDDGSNDGSTPGECDDCVALGPNIRVIHQTNTGLPGARNAGAAVIRQENWGQYLVFLDADDWIQPSFVARLHKEIVEASSAGPDQGRNISHAYCQERLVGMAQGLWAVPEWDFARLIVTNLHPVTALVRREHFEAAGGFDATMTKGYEDWDLWLKFAERGWRGVRVREPLFIWHRHAAVTMVVEAAGRHDELYAMLLERHPEFVRKHAAEALRRASTMLKRSEGSWLDEQDQPIVLRDLRAWTRELVRERDEAREGVVQLEAAHAHERFALEAGLRAEYENKLSVRLSRAMFRLRDRLFRRG